MAKRISVLANDADNGTLLVPGSVEFISTPANGTATIDANGAITYISNAAFVGTDNFEYRVKNTNDQFSNTAAVTITVEAAVACDPNAP